MQHTSNADTDCDDGSEPAITIDMGSFPPRYRDMSLIGFGSKSLIFSAIDQTDHSNPQRIAVKKVCLRGDRKEEDMRQVFMEIRILNRLEHQNIVKIHHVLVSTANDGLSEKGTGLFSGDVQRFDCLYFGMELMDTDLRNVIEKMDLTDEYVRLFLYQLLRGMKYLHSANVVHRDLTPSNVFINMDTLMVKIGDFGVSRLLDYDYDHTYHLSLPLTTKYYQAPELLLHPRHYTRGLDIWSIGCIFAEMLTGTIAFPGDNAYEQMNLFMDSVPVTESDWESAVSAGCMDKNCCPNSFDYSAQDNGGCPTKPFENILSGVETTAINLLNQMLRFDASLRIQAEDALAHPYFVSYANPQDEPSCQRPFHIEDELDEYCTADLQTMLQDISYSVTSSFSRSMDAYSHTGQYERIDDFGSAGVSSGNSLAANGSARHLLTLADNAPNQADQLSESEVRKLEMDFDYGVQIHDCSVNKERMSIDIRPASTSAACFDPYKWDQGSKTVNCLAGTQVMLIKGFTKLNKSLEIERKSSPQMRYSGSQDCSMPPSNPSNVDSDGGCSLSSLELSSELKKKSGDSSPNTFDKPMNTSTDTLTPSTRSPVFSERDSSSVSQRHNDSQSHHSSRRHHHHHSHHHSYHHHHHHHSHHHHHHHHHKHKTKHSHTPANNHNKQNGEDSSNKSSNNHAVEERSFRPLDDVNDMRNDSNKISESPRLQVPTTSTPTSDTQENNKKENMMWCTGDSILSNGTSSNNMRLDSNNKLVDRFANIEVSLTHSKNSAFTKRSTTSKICYAKKQNYVPAINDEIRRIPLSFQSDPPDFANQAIESSSPHLADADENGHLSRPRAWSEGCTLSDSDALSLWKVEDLMKSGSNCGAVGMFFSRLNKIIKQGLCFNRNLPVKFGSDSKSVLWQCRRRHYSDDPSLISSAKLLMNNSAERSTIDSVPLVTCHGAARAGNQAQSRLECPF